MRYSDRLQNIKECDLIEAIKNLTSDFIKPNLDTVIEDVKWLIEQAEKIELIEEETDQIILEKTDRILELEEENEKLKADLIQWKKWYEQATGFPTTKYQ